MTTAVAYIPVLHQGYLKFLTSQQIDVLLLLSPDIIPKEITYLHKDIRALPVDRMTKAIESLQIVGRVEVAAANTLQALAASGDTLLLPDDDVSRALMTQFGWQNSDKIVLSPIFLRWDKKNVKQENTVLSEQEITADELQKKMLGLAISEANKSSDWWRHVGAVVVRDGKPLLTAYNHHLPSEHQPYFDGDARALFSAGVEIEYTSAIHAEADLIASAARAGIPLEGTELYVTTFPCPPCAKLVAAAGIKKLYFVDGYANFDGESVMRAAGVKIAEVAIKSI